LTQGTTLTVVPNYGVDIIPTENGFRQLIGSEVLTVSSVATGLATIPPGANLAEIHVLDNPVVSRLDGTPPTGNGATPVGRRAEDGAYFELEERDEINNFSVVRLNGNPGSDARLYVEYFFQCGSKDLNN
jgi:hypothetical protein